MSRPRSFRTAKIVFTGSDLPDKDKISTWIENAGGKIADSKALADDVTHIIISKRDWHGYAPIVQEARRKGTVYMVKHAWLIDSILLNKKKLCDETLPKYTWEPNHAKRVARKKKRIQQEMNKAKRTARAAVKAEARADGMENEHGRVGSGPAKPMSSRERTPRPRAPKPKKAPVIKQITEIGIKYDKALLENERDMALKGYRPYVDESGMPYLITLVRNDVAKKVKEEYTLKAFKPFSVTYGKPCASKQTTKITYETPNRPSRFDTSHTNAAHYFEGDYGQMTRVNPNVTYTKYEDRPLSFAMSSSGLASSLPKTFEPLPKDGPFETWQQHVPFSAYPVVTYDPALKARDAYGKILEERVHLPRPFAYSLQLYESFDRSEHVRSNFYTLTPSTTNQSFASFLARSDQASSPAVPEVCTTSDTVTDQSRQHPRREKKYYLAYQYSRKGKEPLSPSGPLIPMDSPWETVYKMFCTIFKKKTGLSWEQVKPGASLPSSRRDSGICLGADSQEYVPAQVDPKSLTTDTMNPDTSVSSTTGTFGAGVHESSAPAAYPKEEKWRYIPNTVNNVEEVQIAYAKEYREDWLPVRSKSQRHAALPNCSAAKHARSWVEVVAESKPQYSVCSDNPGAECTRGQD